MEKKTRYLILFAILLLGFLLRIYFIDKKSVTDLLMYGDWGGKIVKFGSTDFYFRKDWDYSGPTYLPLANLLFAGLYWLNDHRYVLAQLHNIIRFPPSSFITYFYKFGNILLLKLPAILSDLGLGILIYGLVRRTTKSANKALWAVGFYVLNPITIFLSGIWGQTDSLVSFLGLASFTLLYLNFSWISIPLLFMSIYVKPSWAIFVPFYFAIIYLKKPRVSHLAWGVLITFLIYFFSTTVFAHGNLFLFTKDIVGKLSIPGKDLGKLSNSAFNFYTIFWQVDRTLASIKVLGLSSSVFGDLVFVIVNIFAIVNLFRKKVTVLAINEGIFIIGFGTFLFVTNMLERYFFPALASMIILMFTEMKVFLNMLFMMIVSFANVIWSFYRRNSDEIDHPFTSNNFLLIRLLSFSELAFYLLNLRSWLMLQFKRGRN